MNGMDLYQTLFLNLSPKGAKGEELDVTWTDFKGNNKSKKAKVK